MFVVDTLLLNTPVMMRRRFLEINRFKNKNGLWWPCLLTDRGEMSSLYRGSSIDASYQVSVKDCSFCPDPLTNMTTTGNYCF
jgi:hypothetical protein